MQKLWLSQGREQECEGREERIRVYLCLKHPWNYTQENTQEKQNYFGDNLKKLEWKCEWEKSTKACLISDALC